MCCVLRPVIYKKSTGHVSLGFMNKSHYITLTKVRYEESPMFLLQVEGSTRGVSGESWESSSLGSMGDVQLISMDAMSGEFLNF